MNQQESIEQKLTRMIDVFREEFDKLTPEEKICEQVYSSLNYPCQLFILSSPINHSHLLIKTHLDSIEDKSIFIYPLQNDSYLEKLNEIVNYLSSVADNEPLIEEDPLMNFNEFLESEIVSFGKQIMSGEIHPFTESYIGGKWSQNARLAVWDIFGDMQEIDFDKYSIDIIQEYKSNYIQNKNNKTKKIQEPITDKNNGFATFFYPPLLIGDFKLNIIQKINQEENKLLDENVFVTNFQNNTLSMTKGGLIGIENTDKEFVEIVFTTMMGVCIVCGIPLQTINSSELAKVTIDTQTHKITGSSWSYSTKRMDMFNMRDMGLEKNIEQRGKISTDNMKDVIKTTETILENREHVELLRTLGNSYTQLSNGDNSQSFITSWIIVERDIYKRWMEKLLDAHVSKRIREDLDRWDLYKVLEILHLDKVIPNDEYIELKSLQHLRNDVIHEGHEVTQKTAEKCFGLSLEIIRKMTGLDKNIEVKYVYI